LTVNTENMLHILNSRADCLSTYGNIYHEKQNRNATCRNLWSLHIQCPVQHPQLNRDSKNFSLRAANNTAKTLVWRPKHEQCKFLTS